QVLGVARQVVVPRVGFAALGVGHHGQVAVARVLGQAVVDAGVFDRHADHRMCRHILHPFSAIIHLAPVFQTRLVLFRCAQPHSLSPRKKRGGIIPPPPRACPCPLKIARDRDRDRPIPSSSVSLLCLILPRSPPPAG